MVSIRLVYIFLFAGVMIGGCSRQPTVSSDPTSFLDSHEAAEVPTREPTSLVPDDSLEMEEEVLETATPMLEEDVVEKDQIFYGLTNHNLDGNRWVRGQGRLPEVEPLDIPLRGVPVWVVGAELGGGSTWVVSLEDGQIQAFHVVDGEAHEISIEPTRLPPGMPPMLMVQEGEPSLVTVREPDASSLTSPMILNSQGDKAYITREGELALASEGEIERLRLQALPDARILKNNLGDLLFLNQATDRYGHGVLGDTIESAAVVLVESSLEERKVTEIQVPEPAVIEGISPIWVDMDGDGEREILVTLSDAKQGAWFVLYDKYGQQVATSEPIGRGFRWRHQIAVAPFGPEGEMELVSVRTPHIGGIVEFHRLEGDELHLATSISGYTTHVLGSRNLDMAAAGDFDGDGRVEILLPHQSMSRLACLRRIQGGVEEAWSLPLTGKLSTNLAAIIFDGNEIGIGVGMDNSTLRLWAH